MKNKLKELFEHWKVSFIFRTLLASVMSSIAGFLFIIFNAVMGIVCSSLWHGTICIYYILLTTVRGTIVFCQRNEKYRHEADLSLFRSRVSKYTHLVLFILNLALVVPISIMVKGQRTYEYGLIPAIAMAVYTFYRIVISSVNLKKARRESNCLVRELRAINMIDTLVAILSLQNTLIMTEGGMNNDMRILTSYTSGGIFALIVFITVRSMIVNKE